MAGNNILGMKAYEIAHSGLAMCRRVRHLPKLTVHQNLMLREKGGKKPSRWSFEDMYKMFRVCVSGSTPKRAYSRAASNRC